MPMNKSCQTPALILNGQSLPIFEGTTHAAWAATAQAKGFSIAARVVDRYHLALRCHACCGLTKTKLFVLMNNQPICAPCLEAKQIAMATAAGVILLRRDPSNRHYAYCRAPCGHELRRQFGKIEEVSRGEKALRCEVCLTAKHGAEAAERGWTLLGADPGGRVAYRLYRHDSCGTEQPVALGNMHTGRFDCATCGESWVTAPSSIYVMRFNLVDGDTVIKLGFARDPVSRLNHQLQVGVKRTGELLRVVGLRTGRAALCEEKAMHRRVAAALPQAVVPRTRFAGQIKVQSEIYTPDALKMVSALLDDLSARLAA